MRATLTILGLYNYDTSIFENLVLPDGVDEGEAVMSIIMDNAELELMYPEPDTMKFLIGLWSTRMLPVWNRVLTAITTEYNPLENYNRTETYNQIDTGESSAESGATSTNKVAGYNDTTLTNSGQTVDNSSGSGNSKLQSVRQSNIKGNIGVTTSQQMLNQELDLVDRTDIYKYISESFKQRFCLMVY